MVEAIFIFKKIGKRKEEKTRRVGGGRDLFWLATEFSAAPVSQPKIAFSGGS
jgi:hypothetical protein